MIITDIKQIYPEFKMFKEMYTRLKVSSQIYFYNNNGVSLEFAKDNAFYRLSGNLLKDSIFCTWIKSGCGALIDIEDINKIAKCLKKNVQSIEYDNTKFIFKFSDKDGNDNSIEIKNISMNTYTSPFRVIKYVERDVDGLLFSDDLIRLYWDGNSVVTERKDVLLLELPRTTVLVTQKDATYKVRFTENPEVDKKYVEIESSTDELKMTQIFATI